MVIDSIRPRDDSSSPPIRCGAGGSTLPHLDEAIAVAAASAAVPLDGAAIDLAIVFISAAHGSAIRPAMESLSELIPARCLLGVTAEAVLANDEEYESGPAVAVWMAALPGADLMPMALEYAQTADGGMFLGWPDEVLWPEQPTILLLADPFSFPVDAFITRLEEDRPGLPIIGGMASGGFQPAANTLAVNNRSYSSGAVGVVIGGGVTVRPVVSQGCRPIGRPLVITRSQENIIVDLGGRPALEQLQAVYETLDEHDRQLVRSSLHLGRVASEYQETFERGDFLVRNVAGADPDSGALAIGDIVRTGQTVQFHVRDAATAHEDLVALLAREQARGTRPAGALVFTCNGRGSRLFDSPSHDARCLQEMLGPIPTAGFFAQGEIGPIGRKNCLHGFTASIAIFQPARSA
jgi:small ligand-binding sensory domain FIST